MEELKVESCSVEKIKEQVMRSFDDASSRRLFNWGRAAALALPYDMMAGWLLKKGADGSKRLARTLTPPKSANKNREICLLFRSGRVDYTVPTSRRFFLLER
jgi:hypothetical protein